MGIEDRVKEAIDKLQMGDPINALIQVSIAIDATAKKVDPYMTTRPRCRRWLSVNQAFITRVAFGKLEIQGPIKFIMENEIKSLEQILYDTVRCSLLHEGELPKTIYLTKEAQFGMTSDGKVIISEKLIWAMILAVIGSPKNKKLKLPDFYTASIGTVTINLNNLWGNREEIYDLVNRHNI